MAAIYDELLEKKKKHGINTVMILSTMQRNALKLHVYFELQWIAKPKRFSVYQCYEFNPYVLPVPMTSVM